MDLMDFRIKLLKYYENLIVKLTTGSEKNMSEIHNVGYILIITDVTK
jgi:hypothetical protein